MCLHHLHRQEGVCVLVFQQMWMSVCVCISFRRNQMAENKKINSMSVDKQILLCSRCNLGPGISHGDEHNSYEWTLSLPTHIQKHQCRYMIKHKYTQTQPIIRGLIWNKSGKEVKLKRTIFYLCIVCLLSAAGSLPMENAHRWQRFHVGKINVADSGTRMLFQTYKKVASKVLCMSKWRISGICCQDELLDISLRVKLLLMICIVAAPCFNLVQHMKHTHKNTSVKGYSEEGWCETQPQTEPDCCHEYNSVGVRKKETDTLVDYCYCQLTKSHTE